MIPTDHTSGGGNGCLPDSPTRHAPDHVAAGKGPGDTHIVVIGSGGSAFAGAIRAAEAGVRVTMVESDIVGGTCVNIGCVPSKIILRAAEVAHRRTHHPFDGIPRDPGTVDRGACSSNYVSRWRNCARPSTRRYWTIMT